MSSLLSITDNASEEEQILPEVEELEFRSNELSTIEDIQEELEKLESNRNNNASQTAAVDVNVVDHEVTVIADQANEEISILPELPKTAYQSKTADNPVVVRLNQNITDVENNQIVREILDQEDSNISLSTKIMVNNESSKTSVSEQTYAKPLTQTSVSKPISQLQILRPLSDSVKSNKSLISIGQHKKNVLTKVIFTPNNQVAPDAPIMFGEAGGQTIRLVGQSKAIITSSGSTKAITFAQAREMGLLSPGKMHILPSQPKGTLKKNVVVSGNKTITMVRSSPSKILPLPTTSHLHPIAPSPTVNSMTSTHKILIRQSPSTVKSGAFSGTFLANTSVGSTGQYLQLPVSQGSNQIHQIHLPGKQVQYVRLINSVSTNSATVPMETIIKSEPTIASSVSTTIANTKPIPVALSTNIANPPANKVTTVAPVQALSGTAATQLPPSSKPASIFTQSSPSLSPSSSPPQSTLPSPVLLTKAKEVFCHKEPVTTPFSITVTQKVKLPSESHNGIRPRKPCNCTKSQCLKLYCDCFANGEFCFQCNCNCCYNNLDYEEERQKAIKACLERNPNAFRPKIGKGYVGDERRHNKGCNCKRSGCLKNYCECYEAKIPCSNNCKCIGCRNIEEFRDSQDRCISEVNKINQQLSVKTKLCEIQETPGKPHMFTTNQTSRQPSNLMTQEVVEATCQCLLAQSESKGKLPEDVERLILEEFGRCLVEIIDYATRTTVPNTT